MNDTLIKAIITNRYSVELFETPCNLYGIKYTNFSTERNEYSELTLDYKMASYLFDLKVDELEGQ